MVVQHQKLRLGDQRNAIPLVRGTLPSEVWQAFHGTWWDFVNKLGPKPVDVGVRRQLRQHVVLVFKLVPGCVGRCAKVKHQFQGVFLSRAGNAAAFAHRRKHHAVLPAAHGVDDVEIQR